MGRKSVVVAVVLCFAAFSTALAGLETKVEETAIVKSKVGVGPAVLAPGRFPAFQYKAGWSSNDVCGFRLQNAVSLTEIPNQIKYSVVGGVLEPLELDVRVPESMRSNSKLLITWTIRIEGTGTLISPASASGNLAAARCSPWSGSINETFKGGLVNSRAEVNLNDGRGYQAYGETGMTVPDGKTLTSYTPPPSDPTSTGSCVITGPFTADPIKVRIAWKNNTSLTLTSAANYRNLIVNIVPVKE